MSSETNFYKKNFQIQCDYPAAKIEKDKLVIHNSSEQWAGGFPWTVSIQYKCTGRKGTAPFLSVFIKVAKGDEAEWSCVSTSTFRLVSQDPESRDITWTIQKEYKHSANNWGNTKFCDWTKLPSFVKDGKMFFEVNLTVDKESCKGGALPPGAIEDLLKEKTLENENLKSELKKKYELIDEKDRELSSLKAQLDKTKAQLEKLRVRNEKIRMRETEAKANKDGDKAVQEEKVAQGDSVDQNKSDD